MGFKISRPGDLTRKAKVAGMSVSDFALAHLKDKTLTGKQCRFYYYILRGASRKKKDKAKQ